MWGIRTAACFFGLGLVHLLPVPAGHAADWQQWRGPNRDGVVRGVKVPTKWPETLTEEWTVEVGEGYSSPVVWGGNVVVFTRQAGKEVVRCLDVATGKEVYQGKMSTGGEFYASPLVADGKVYCVSRFTGTFVFADESKFRELAHNQFADDDSRTNACPIAHEGCLLLRTDKHLVCIGKK